MNQAIGLVEVTGLASAIEVSDTMVKVANVELLGVEKARGFGWMTVKVAGDVGAVKAAVDAGKAKAVENDVYLSALVIPRPANKLEEFFFKKEEKVPEKIQESPVKEEQSASEDVVQEPIEPVLKEEPVKEEPPAAAEKPAEEPKKKKNSPKGSKKSSEPRKKK